ncbi:MAG TPA: hypothetical protein VIF60_08280 [Burkholderiaceae bacterium]|jgi:hypothetical protein
MRTLMLVLALCTLTACSTPADRAARAQREVEQMMQEFGPACDKLGYTRDSDAWRNCVLKLGTEQNAQRYPLMTTCFRSPGMLHCDSF